MVPNMLRASATVAVAAATVAGCSPSTVGSNTTYLPTTTTASPTTPGSTRPTAAPLTVPAATHGEVSRTVLRIAGAATPGSSSTVGRPVKGRSYVVHSACTADGAQSVTITYRLVDARSSSADIPNDERTVMSAQTPCDGRPHMDQVGTLDFPVTVDYDGTAGAVATAYTIVTPQ